LHLRIIVVVALLSLTAGNLSPIGESLAKDDSRFFPETGKSVQGSFLQYWTEHGGLAQQGYPISDQMQERSDTDGKTYTVQYFERAVFEMHPENRPPYDVLLSLLGTALYKEKHAGNAPSQSASRDANARLFTETGKTVGGNFLDYWNAHGGLAQQGYPISNEFTEKSALDGKEYTVQYFERAVFEMHPENAKPNDVLLSQLGTFSYRERYTQASKQPPPTPETTTSTMSGRVTQIANMSVPRSCHSSTLLPNGKVLIAGGEQRSGVFLMTAELYDPATGKFTPTGSMNKERECHEAVPLPNGKVLMIAGSTSDVGSSAELYDPASGTFSPTGSLIEGRSEPFTATPLKNGKVLVVGGFNGKLMQEAELYDPATGKFSPTGSMKEGRTNHTATLLADGRVLVTGGGIADLPPSPTDYVMSSSEVYDPNTGQWSTTGSLATPRYKHGATLLNDGRVLVVAGSDQRQTSGFVTSAELFDPRSGQFSSAGNVSIPRYKIDGAVVTLPNGKVLVGGSRQVETYDPSTNSFSIVDGDMSSDHFFQSATLLLDGSVLLTGGYNRGNASSSAAWLYRP